MLPRKCRSLVIWRIPSKSALNKLITSPQKKPIRVREHINKELAGKSKQADKQFPENSIFRTAWQLCVEGTLGHTEGLGDVE